MYDPIFETKTATNFFVKLFRVETDEWFEYFRKDPLLFVILITCAIRARRTNLKSPNGLSKGEFWISEMEYIKFGLKKSQKGKIRTRIQQLIEKEFIAKTEKKTGKEQSIVYALKSTKLIDPNFDKDF